MSDLSQAAGPCPTCGQPVVWLRPENGHVGARRMPDVGLDPVSTPDGTVLIERGRVVVPGATRRAAAFALGRSLYRVHACAIREAS